MKIVITSLLLLLLGLGVWLYSRTQHIPASVISEEDAIEKVISLNPELASYRTTDLPPHAIETEKSGNEAWHVGFIRYGSGLPGVLDARCFRVGPGGQVDTIGVVERAEAVITYVKLDTCTPAFEDVGVLPAEPKEPMPGETPPEPSDPIRDPDTPVSGGGCFIGGCSGQLCTEDSGAISTCEYRPEYACYSGAECKRQSDGRCGWTMDAELRACLSNSGVTTAY